jgi:DNA-directed RNA polymerase subunit M/transcription elongation factor TFIIS
MNYKGVKDKVFTCLNCGSEFKFKGHSYNNKYCNNKCQAELKHKQSIEEKNKLFDLGELTFRRDIYKILIERFGDECSVCGITEWNNKPIRLWVDHIDGDASNNTPSNFRLICPNCDSQSDTFGAKNIGSGRKSRGLKMYG